MSDEESILKGFTPQEAWAKREKVSPRTVATYRAEGLPFVFFGGKIYIGPDGEARTWLLGRVRRKNQRRVA